VKKTTETDLEKLCDWSAKKYLLLNLVGGTLRTLYHQLKIGWPRKSNLEHKRCADGHENNDFDTTTASMWKLSFDSKGYGAKGLTFYVLDLVYLTSPFFDFIIVLLPRLLQLQIQQNSIIQAHPTACRIPKRVKKETINTAQNLKEHRNGLKLGNSFKENNVVAK